MNRVIIAIIGASLLGVGVPAWGQVAKTEDQPPRLDDAPGFQGARERWAGLMDEFDVPGMAVAIVKDGRVVAVETFGVRSPSKAAAGDAPTPDTLYYIASITKTYLATAVCALADDGKLKLDDPVQKHLPRFKLPKATEGSAEKITLRDLLSHRAGLIDGQPIAVLDAYTGEITEDRYFKWLALMRVKGETAYTNVHFTLLGRVVEAASGKPWQDYLSDRVLKPAGLTRTTSSARRMYADADCSLPMERVDGKWRVCQQRKTDRTMHAAGGLAATARDAARYLFLHLNDGEIDGMRVISAVRAKEMRTQQSKLSKTRDQVGVISGFGLGWETGTFRGTPMCAHGGGYAGTTAYYALLPDKKCGVAVLMNAGGAAGGLIEVMAADVLGRLVGSDKRIDVLDEYRKRIGEWKKQAAGREAKLKAEREKPFELSKPLGGYAGRFLNDDLGTMTVAVDGKRLKVTLGECELDVASAGADSFKLLGAPLGGAVFKFLVTAGEVTALRLEGDEQSIVFKK